MNPVINKAKKFIKNPYWRAKCKYIKYFDKLPIDEKAIFIESQHGDEFNGNVFYIVKYLRSNEKYNDFKVYLSCRLSKVEVFKQKLEAYGIKNVDIVVLSSKEYFKTIASAKFLINDNTFLPFYQKGGDRFISTPGMVLRSNHWAGKLKTTLKTSETLKRISFLQTTYYSLMNTQWSI